MRSVVLAGVCWLAVAGGARASGDPLAAVAGWAIGRALPGAKVDVAAVKVLGVSELDIHGLVVRDRATGAEVLRIDSGRVAFSFDGLMKSRIDELRLVNPVITANSGIGALFGSTPGSGGGSGWSIGRLVCDYGEVQFGTTGENAALLRWKFALDWKGLGSAEASPLSVLLWDVQGYATGVAAPFLLLDRVELSAQPSSLAGSVIDSARVAGGRLFVGPALEKLFGGAPSAGAGGAAQWKIGTLEIERVGVTIADKRPEVSDITFVLNTSLKDLSLSGAAGALGQTPQQVEIADLDVRSPYDPLVRVLSLRSIFIRFTLAGLLRREIADVRILNPTIYIGEDLFWYMDEAQGRFGGDSSAAGSGTSWVIQELGIEFGRLVLASGGRERYGLPLNFRATARDVALDNLASLELRTELEIPAQEYAFESYQLTIQTRRGDLRFSYPPEQGRKNLVGKIFVERIVWRQYRAVDAWISATFDREGINGEFGGVAYNGYLSGGFSFLFDARSPWIGWLAGTGIDLEKLTDVMAPQNFRMTGPVDFRLQMDAFGRNIERITGDLRARGKGTLHISKLDDLLANIPADWPSIKSGSLRIALESLRDFDYVKAGGDLWFVREQGRLDLRLQGPTGSRTFDVVLHADESKEGRWKK